MIRGPGGRGAADTSEAANVPKNFEILPVNSLRCRVHPVVVFTILDAFIRRDEGQQNVIGTLLGSVSEGNVVDISDCFVDRHSLTGDGLLQIIKDHHESMYDLKQQVSGGSGSNTREVVVGWFCTGAVMTELTCAVHGWFKQFGNVSKFVPQPPLTEPIHLMIDTAMEKRSLSIKAFLQVPMTMAKEACFQFAEVPLEIYTTASDRAGLALMLKLRRQQPQYLQFENSSDEDNVDWNIGSEALPASSIPEGFTAALTKLLSDIDKLRKYVNDVLYQKEEPNTEIGRFLALTLASAAVQDKEAFESMCQAALHDHLMVSHLTSLAKVQIALAEKLNTSFF